MGGMEEGGGILTENERAEALITRENVGDLMLLGYADFLRRWDAAQSSAVILGKLGTSFRKDAYEGIDAVLGSKWEEVDPEKIDPEQFSAEAITQPAVMSLICGSLAKLRKERVGDVYGNVVEDTERGVRIVWPNASKVEIVALTPKSESAIYTQFGNRTTKITGALVDTRLNYVGGAISVCAARGFRNRSIRPLIDRENGYTATVSLRYLED